MSNKHHTLLIVGGGAAGVSVANNMRRQNADIDIAIDRTRPKNIITSPASPLSAAARTP